MRLNLDKILENAFILNLDFEKGDKYGRDTRKELEQSLERFINIFGNDPSSLIQSLEAAIHKEVKKKTLRVFRETKLTEEDKQYFKPLTLTSEDVDNLEKENGSRSNNVRNNESSSQPVERVIHRDESSDENYQGAS
jgi:hypothetical protein